MSDKIVQSIVPGSLQSQGNTALALLKAKKVIIVDCSDSMNLRDADKGKSRWEVANEILAALQNKHRGLIILLCFNESVQICTDGNLMEAAGATYLVKALNKAKEFIGINKEFVLITDGLPNDTESDVFGALLPFKNKLSIVYVGPELNEGNAFCKKMSDFVNGVYTKGDLKTPDLLAGQIETLLLQKGV